MMVSSFAVERLRDDGGVGCSKWYSVGSIGSVFRPLVEPVGWTKDDLLKGERTYARPAGHLANGFSLNEGMLEKLLGIFYIGVIVSGGGLETSRAV